MLTANKAVFFGDNANLTFGYMDSLLLAPTKNLHQHPTNIKDMTNYLRSIIATVPEIRVLFVVDSSGKIITK